MKKSEQSGMTLIEVIVSLAIFSVVLMGLGGLMYEVARNATRSAGSTYRAAAVQRAAGLATTVPYDSLPGLVGCSADTIGTLPFTQCITVASVSTTQRRVTVTITPGGTLGLTPVTQVVRRIDNLLSSPFAN